MTNDCENCHIILAKCDCGETHAEGHNGPICPYCGEEESAVNEPLLYDQTATEGVCGSCGKEYEMEVCISYSWDTHRKDNDDDL